MVNYILINPLKNNGFGISSYIDIANRYLEDDIFKHVNVHIISNDEKLDRAAFQHYISTYIAKNFSKSNTIIESPETYASTLTLAGYYVHIRLHTPIAIVQRINKVPVDEIRLQEECQVINNASIVSAPSDAIVDELSDDINFSDVNKVIYRNPIMQIHNNGSYLKEYDVVFMGRNERLKGVEYLNSILEQLPPHYNVLIFGQRMNDFTLSTNIQCHVTVKGALYGEDKIDALNKSKCILALSLFENCSMVILEALAMHIPVICWDVAGNAEFIAEGMVFGAKIGDINTINDHILYINQTELPLPVFNEMCFLIYSEFLSGLKVILNDFNDTMFKGEKIVRHNFRGYKFSNISLNKTSLPLPSDTYIVDTRKVSISNFDFSIFDDSTVNNLILKGNIGSDLFDYISKSKFNVSEIPSLDTESF